jgi:hypothetical protein
MSQQQIQDLIRKEITSNDIWTDIRDIFPTFSRQCLSVNCRCQVLALASYPFRVSGSFNCSPGHLCNE